MSEELDYADLADFIEAAVQAFVHQQGKGGMTIGYVTMLEIMDEDGDFRTFVTKRDGQPVYRSMGYATYLNEWFRDDAQMGMASLYLENGDE